MSDTLDIATRAATRKDLPFLFDSYWRSYIAYMGRPKESALMRLRDRFSGLWLRAQFVLVVDPDDAQHILGWICHEGPVLHYTYVKAAYRGQGLARSMIAAAGLAAASRLMATHWVPAASLIAAKYPMLSCICLDMPIVAEVFNDESENNAPQSAASAVRVAPAL